LDGFTGRVRDYALVVASYSNLNKAAGYRRHVVHFNSTGEPITLAFVGTENASNKTSFVIDDVSRMKD
jgi:hypothetical protein